MRDLRHIFFNELTLGSDKWEPYFDVYETYFSKFVDKAPVVVEVGVQSGGSLQLWRKYFGPAAQIWGIDIDAGVTNLQQHYDVDTHILIGDQADPAFWRRELPNIPEIDIFIDDGGHAPAQHRVTFEHVFPRLRHGGVYICEDTHTCYFQHMGTGRGQSNSFMEYAKNLADLLHVQFLEDRRFDDQATLALTQGLRSVHFYNSMIVFLKDKLQTFNRVIVNK